MITCSPCGADSRASTTLTAVRVATLGLLLMQIIKTVAHCRPQQWLLWAILSLVDVKIRAVDYSPIALMEE